MTTETYKLPARLGGNTALDFANTVEFRDTERRGDYLRTFGHLAAWCGVDGGALDAHQQGETFAAALRLRDALYHIFTAYLDENPPATEDMAALNAALGRAQRRVETEDSEHFVWGWASPDILAPIAQAAAELLTSDDLHRVRQCPNCGWLFVDTSRNHSRRWCSMDFCGSQVKSRRQYQRKKAESA